MPEGLANFLETVFIVIQIVVGLGFLIFIHEAGHFLVAKWKGVRVDAFSLGMGPILWKRFWKGTEYRISAIPLGGYVKMAGENIGDPKTGAPDELTSKSAFARLQIFAAGALMNLFIAFPLAILACLAGRSEGAPVIGSPSYADTEAQLQPGDRLLEAGGRKVESSDDYRKLMVRSPQGKMIDVVVDRGGQRHTVQVKVMESKRHGTLPPPTTIPKIKRGSPAYEKGLRSFVEILKINDEPARFELGEFREQLAYASTPLKLSFRNPGEEERTVVLDNLPSPVEEDCISKDYRLMEPVIAQPEANTPAGEAGLQGGDVIVQINNTPIASFHDIFGAVTPLAGKRVPVEYKRAGITKTVDVLIRYKSQGKGMLGVRPGRSSKVVHVAEDSPFHKAGLRSNDVLVSIATLPEPATIDIAGGRIGSVKVTVRRDQETKELEIVPGEKRKRLNLEDVGFKTEEGQLIVAYNRIERTWGFQGAIVAGLYEPVDVIEITLGILKKLFVGQEDAAGMAGPAGIFKASFIHAEAGLGNFLWLLVLITVNLGIFNLLPVPVLDGGHILLLAIEKIKGGPPSPRFVERFQLVGLVLLLSLLIFVTVNDFRPGR
ncbi:MAG TPA: site-2 protease family protein [Planctomycetota bacterium]|nr:site-2 protease family protein [Planctomycetota bacterium]